MKLITCLNIFIGGLLLAAVILLSGCSNDDGTAAADDGAIRFKTDVWQVMEGTRATTYDTPAAIQAEGSFTCTAYDKGTTEINSTSEVNNETVIWNSTSWAFEDGTHKWPTEGALDFFAYMPAAESLATDAPYITAVSYTTARAPQFTCDMTRTVAKEFIYALALDQDKEGTNSTAQPTRGQVALTFQHPFARIYFKLSSASGTAVTINSVTISGEDFYKTGTCTFDGTTSTWSSKGGASSLGALAINTPYIVIPNDYGSSKTITVEAEWNDWSKVTKTITSSPLSINWQTGYSYTYTLTLTKYTLEVDTSKYTEQW